MKLNKKFLITTVGILGLSTICAITIPFISSCSSNNNDNNDKNNNQDNNIQNENQITKQLQELINQTPSNPTDEKLCLYGNPIEQIKSIMPKDKYNMIINKTNDLLADGKNGMVQNYNIFNQDHSKYESQCLYTINQNINYLNVGDNYISYAVSGFEDIKITSTGNINGLKAVANKDIVGNNIFVARFSTFYFNQANNQFYQYEKTYQSKQFNKKQGQFIQTEFTDFYACLNDYESDYKNNNLWLQTTLDHVQSDIDGTFITNAQLQNFFNNENNRFKKPIKSEENPEYYIEAYLQLITN